MGEVQISFEDFRDEWLTSVTDNAHSTLELGRLFAHKLITQWLEVDSAPDDLIYCDGSGDGGIDLAYLDRGMGDEDGEEHTWYLVQSKYGSAFQGTSTLLQEGQKVVDTLDGQRKNLSSLASSLLERLLNFRKQAGENDRIVLVFATVEPLDESHKQVIRDLQALGRGRLGSIFDVQSVSVDTIYERMLEETEAEPSLAVPLKANIISSGEDDLLIGAVSLTDLYAFLKAYRDSTQDLDRLYEKNVRRFLGSRGKINRSMQKTLRENPERFGLYNNGITVVASDFERLEDGVFQLIEPYVVNGCQTTRTIWEVCHERLEAGGTGANPEMEEWQQKVDRGVVILKVVKVGHDGEGMLIDITRYTNSQNAVREKDFLALTRDFKSWAHQMEELHQVYLEIQRGGWDSRRALQKQRPDMPQLKRWTNAFDLLKVYGAGWMGEAGMAFTKNAPFLPNGSVFERIMASEDGSFGVDDLYAAYLLQSRANGYEFGRGAPQPSRRQTRFLFYMVAIELLKHVLLRSSQSVTRPAITRALIALDEPSNRDAAQLLFDQAVEIVDSYMTQGSDSSVFDEPAYRDAFNYDLNAFLKWEKLGKSNDDTPQLTMALSVGKMAMKSYLEPLSAAVI